MSTCTSSVPVFDSHTTTSGEGFRPFGAPYHTCSLVVVEIDCETSMKLETSPKVTKSKRSLHWCRSISKQLSVQVLLQYQSKSYYIIGQEVYYSIGRFYYIIGHLLHYRAFFITLSGTYYSIGRLLHYRLVQALLQTN